MLYIEFIWRVNNFFTVQYEKLQPVTLKGVIVDIEQRLNRIEEKLDGVSEMLGQLARIEERATGLETRLNRHEYRLDVIEGLQRDQSKELSEHVGKGHVWERAAWIVLAAVLSAMGKIF